MEPRRQHHYSAALKGRSRTAMKASGDRICYMVKKNFDQGNPSADFTVRIWRQAGRQIDSETHNLAGWQNSMECES